MPGTNLTDGVGGSGEGSLNKLEEEVLDSEQDLTHMPKVSSHSIPVERVYSRAQCKMCQHLYSVHVCCELKDAVRLLIVNRFPCIGYRDVVVYLVSSH